MTAGSHRSGHSVWPTLRAHSRDAGISSSGLLTGQQEGRPASSTPGARSWPVDASPADVAAARQWLADYPERFPASLPPPPYPHPAIGPLMELVIAGHNAAAVLDAALRHEQEAFSE